MVASPPPLLPAVSQQQQHHQPPQQRYGLPPAPPSPLLPPPPSASSMANASVANGPPPTSTERPTPSRASEIRRATKPIMEKRRRARINQCLTELKALILDALNKDPSRHSKLEKADILEMTVRHLQNVQRHQVAAALSTDPVVMSKFRAGFAECATEVSRYVTRLEGVEPSLRQRLVGHLTTCVSGLNGASVGGPTSPLGGVAPGLLISPLSVQIPNLGDLHGVAPSGPLAAAAVGAGGAPGRLQLGGLPLIPSRLPNGDLAFVLPTVAATTSGGGGSAAAPSNSAAAVGAGGLPPSWGPPDADEHVDADVAAPSTVTESREQFRWQSAVQPRGQRYRQRGCLLVRRPVDAPEVALLLFAAALGVPRRPGSDASAPFLPRRHPARSRGHRCGDAVPG
ncbi:hypothetical protein MTO96_032141 [Rhipicephalus appendiculatus]